jgi:hypothetical protein
VPAHLLPHEDGWYEWIDEQPMAVPVFVQVDEADDGRVHVVALHIEGIVSAEVLRTIPIGRIEALANAVLHPQAANQGWRAVARLPDELLLGSKRGRPDEFYATVASTYRHLVTATARPVAELADANEVPRTTAHRWVKEARRRGMLPPGRPGKAG